MKLRIYIRQILIIAFMIISFHYKVYSQGTEIVKGNPAGLFFGLNLGPSQSHIKNEEIQSITELLSTKKNTFSGSVEIGYFFSNYIGLSSGVGFVSYKTQLTLDSYQSKFNTTDSENETYERQVTGSGIMEDQNVGLLSVPVCLNLRLPFGKSVGFFLQPGISLSIPLSKDYMSSGTFTYKGYYSAYNVLLENFPEFDFPSNLNTNTEGELELKPMSFNFIASAGFDFLIIQKIQIAVAACYDKSLSSISEYSSPDKFQLSSDVNKINSFMGGSSKTTAQSMGVKIVFRYYLK